MKVIDQTAERGLQQGPDDPIFEMMNVDQAVLHVGVEGEHGEGCGKLDLTIDHLNRIACADVVE